ncbi:glycosyltransferase family 2 protein [Hymenobacter aerilatus]|uniref:Glycosyltransferase family 2 protein n=1 Tax=Hymenobacter aerilatus TaxID=2932251 RepID=A0A8T9SRN8_9BACT|nr:glycosyltransferase family 2 protein [Hymenobacter aerilatus]UOR04485.1 glycosyltransferase family 2 protein [Hymenobacter aerilatus]
MNAITVILLTHNEEKHIARCLKSLAPIAAAVFVIDSFSTDRTCDIAREMGAQVFQNPWVNYSTQFNWALQNCPIQTPWTMRMDCDEYLLPELITEIQQKIPVARPEVGGFIIKRRVYFMDRWIKHGGFYPHRLLRIWRTNTATLEDRWMDEHVVLEAGTTEALTHDMVDHNLNDLTWWINKHNHYATREMLDLLAIHNKTTSAQNVDVSLSGEQYSRKRWVKEKLYSRIPLFAGPFFYFLYRYFLLLGFLDGKPGLIWHFLQGFWYRFLVDAKLYEHRLRAPKS